MRFSKEDEAKSVLEKAKAENDGKVIWDGTELQCSVLEGIYSSVHALLFLQPVLTPRNN